MYCFYSRVLLLYFTLVEVKHGQASDMLSETIEVAALGRPLFPGMLYDCRKDSFIPGVTLWDKKSLREDLDIRPQLKTDLKFSSSDSLSSKSNLLGVSASLKASFLLGLVEVGGSAKFLHDTKSSNQQSRVTMHYSETSRFDQLTMTQLGKITYPQVFEQKTATHVVTAVLYGAQAIMVFDRSFTEEENKQDIEGELSVMIKKIPGFSIEGKGALKMTDDDNKKAESITCTFYGDVRLEQSPTTYLEALEVYKNLPKHLKDNPQNAVPIKVWLYPLSLLDTKAAQLGREISTSLIYKTEGMMERLRDVERMYNDLSRRTEVKVFSDVKTRLRSFQDSFRIYKMVLQKALARILPAIRGGSMEEQSLGHILITHSSSPFNAGLLNQWLEDAKSELKLLKDYTTILNEINIVDSNRLRYILLDPDINVVVSLTFTSLKYKDPYLSSLAEFLKSKKLTKLDEEINLPSVTPDTRKWFNDPEVIAKMRENLLIFRKFSEANKHTKRIQFLISIISNPSTPGTSIYLYENGKLTDTKFQPVSKPPPPIIEQVLGETVSLKLRKPSTGETVKYRVEYKQVETGSGDEEDWLVTDTPDDDFTLTELKPGKQYQIRNRIVGKVGVSEASETVTKKNCAYQRKKAASENERFVRVCEHGMDYVYKAKVVMMDRTQYIDLKVESVLREGADEYVEGRVIRCLAPLSCREHLGLVKDKSYLIMGKFEDLIILRGRLHYVFGDETWVEYWPTREEKHLPEHRDRYIILNALENTLIMYGCPM